MSLYPTSFSQGSGWRSTPWSSQQTQPVGPEEKPQLPRPIDPPPMYVNVISRGSEIPPHPQRLDHDRSQYRSSVQLPSVSSLLTSNPGPIRPRSPPSPHWSVSNKGSGHPSPSTSLQEPPSHSTNFHFSPKKSTSSAHIPSIRETPIAFPSLERSFHGTGPSGAASPAYGRAGLSNLSTTSFHNPSRSDPSPGYLSYSAQARQVAPPPPSDVLRLERPPADSQSANSTPTRGIWTGAQFLPRFIGEQNVPGEGPCFFYDDGTHCKTVIDGEPVNAHWGVTKAGKPRKRLAVACLTCREKKIKCEPDLPKCVQCEKFGRNCRFQNAPRGHRMSPEPRSSEASDSKSATASPAQASDAKPVQSPSSDRKNLSSPKGQKRMYYEDSIQKKAENSKAIGVNDLKSPVSKRRRLSSPDISWGMIGGLGRKRRDHREPISPEFACENPCQPPRLLDPSAFNWQTDPYELDPDLTMHTIDLYFSHINAATYHIFSQRPFMKWLENCSKKNREDLMLLYTMMALGSIFSPSSKRRSDGKHLFSVARYAVDKSQGELSVQLCQSRLLISLYQFATGNSTGAWDYCGAGLRLASGLRLNLEEGAMAFRGDEPLEYGLKRSTLAECRRRTFWSAFLMDSFTGFCMGRFNLLRSEDIYTRLPCDEEAYELQIKTSAPYFDNGIIDPDLTRADSDMPGLMGLLVIISSIWDDVLANIYRSLHRSKNNYEDQYEKFYAHAQERIKSWQAKLPSHLTWSAQNLDRSITQGYAAKFLTLHAFHHITLMRLHRHVRPALLSHDRILRNLRAANSYARNFLNMMTPLSEESRASRLPEAHNKSFSLSSTPFVGFAVLAAVDILAARGPMARCTETLQLVNGGLTVVHELASVWASAKGQTKALVGRITELGTCLLSEEEQNKENKNKQREGESQNHSMGKVEGGMFKCKAPLETTYPLDSDLVYSAPVGLVLEAFD